MKLRPITLLLFIGGLLALNSCESYQSLSIAASDPIISYSGRIDHSSKDKADLYWPGSSIRINFEGDSLFAILQDERGLNYFNVIIDSDSVRLLPLDTLSSRYLLAAGLSEGMHSVELFKRTEWDKGKTTFLGFELTGKRMEVDKAHSRKRKMEFYGNSITAGYAVDDTTGMDRPDSIYTNHYVSYASLVARHFEAEYHSICKSGIGITISWFPLTMPEIYDRLIPQDSTSVWDFAQYTPEVIVVNLMQNDCWLVERPEYPLFKARFGEFKPSEDEIISAYRLFIQQVRNKNPEAHMVCLLGNMSITEEGSPWPQYVKKAVAQLNDDRMYTHVVPYKGTPGHPSRAEQEALAESLISFIDSNITW
ncbi:MAG: GDSL-type esterase/lipase family protein [Reichenbachiella sp.]|uniref:GDSL-type esterase/lipase family protein n=1 Tax=Reichenbachiella sp. TaxID=2184521 RepID=UPI00296623BD|nr:GDSL-type esterase/lipase family protein [Reichenbachiella sp.]MDW3211994.1 GDSL-type esterase/lipase family protein [Reichenbachiella sp.]